MSYLYSIINNIIEYRKIDENNKEAERIEKSLILTLPKVLRIIFETLSDIKFEECHRGAQNKEQAFTVLYSILFIANGEPT